MINGVGNFGYLYRERFPIDRELELYAEVEARGTIGKAIARIISVATTCVTLKPLSSPPPYAVAASAAHDEKVDA